MAQDRHVLSGIGLDAFLSECNKLHVHAQQQHAWLILLADLHLTAVLHNWRLTNWKYCCAVFRLSALPLDCPMLACTTACVSKYVRQVWVSMCVHMSVCV